MLVVADERFSDFEMREQMAAVAGVFAGDEIDGFQNLQRAKRDVAEVSDGCGDEVEHGKCVQYRARCRTESPESVRWLDRSLKAAIDEGVACSFLGRATFSKIPLQ